MVWTRISAPAAACFRKRRVNSPWPYTLMKKVRLKALSLLRAKWRPQKLHAVDTSAWPSTSRSIASGPGRLMTSGSRSSSAASMPASVRKSASTTPGGSSRRASFRGASMASRMMRKGMRFSVLLRCCMSSSVSPPVFKPTIVAPACFTFFSCCSTAKSQVYTVTLCPLLVSSAAMCRTGSMCPDCGAETTATLIGPLLDDGVTPSCQL
mmetsp:Transcript_126185/g.351585  ORF Transcript_126185/g.351585 Transcript_126185/m.351585 type:complete len:209 (+) Transcript_126185:916-1542(+)